MAQDISTILNKRIGEIIAELVGNNRLKKMFDSRGGLPKEFEGQDSGQVAVELGLIDQNTKTAILTAQAAARILSAMDSLEDFLDSGIEAVRAGEPVDQKALGYLAYDDPAFRIVGSERDPRLLREARATWQLAHMYFQNEVLAARADASRDRAHGKPSSRGGNYIPSFRAQAASYYHKAAAILEGKYKDIAQKFNVAAISSGPTDVPNMLLNIARGAFHISPSSPEPADVSNTPHDFAISLAMNKEKADEQLPYYQTLARLTELTSEQAEAARLPKGMAR